VDAFNIVPLERKLCKETSAFKGHNRVKKRWGRKVLVKDIKVITFSSN
jgi:cytochrome c oxidase assembly protein Cox11